MATISVSDETRKELLKLKIEEGEKNLDALLKKIIVHYKRYKFLKASAAFKKKLKEKGVSISDISSKDFWVIEFETEEESSS